MNSIKYLICSLMLIVGLAVSANNADAALSAINDEPASAIIAYYNTIDKDSNAEYAIQITNTNVSNGVTVHVQTIANNETGCAEIKDFEHILTQADTDILDQSTLGIPDESEGFVVIFAVDDTDTFVPREFPHLIAHTWLVNWGGDSAQAALVNTAGRVLSGGAYEVIQPTDLIAPYLGIAGDSNAVNIASVSWNDAYTGAGAYEAEAGTAVTTGTGLIPAGVLNFDVLEKNFSCGDATFVCGSCTGVEDDTDTEEGETCTYSENGLCSDHQDTGFVNFLGITGAPEGNLIVMVGDEASGDVSGLDYVAQVDPTGGVEPPVDCTDDPCSKGDDCTAECIAETCTDPLTDCAEEDICDGVTINGATCVDGGPTETNCTDEVDGVPVDNDGDLDANCADDDCANDAACQDNGNGGQGGGGGGCSVATAATGLGSMANALVLLIPAFGIGARRIRQRLNK